MSDCAAPRVHPTATVHPAARLGPGCVVGPGAVIDGDVTLGPECEVGPHVHLTGHTVIGARNRFHAGAVIGDAPQDFKYAGQPTRLRMGDGNVFREHVTVHRSNRPDEDTVLGDGNFLMAGSHVGHNCRIGSHNVLANGALLGGHVTLGDRAFISGNCLVHQFCRVGRLALMQGGAAISQDLPPFCLASGHNGLAGLNTVGLRRAGIAAADRQLLRQVYHRLFRRPVRWPEALADVERALAGHPLVEEILGFIRASRRGVLRSAAPASPAGEGPDPAD